MRYKRRNSRSGRYQRNYLFSHLFFFSIVIGSVVGLPYIAGTQAYYMMKNAKNVFVVENTQAESVITNEDIAEARIARLINEVYRVAKIHGVNGYQMERTIECESRFNNVQSSAYKNGVREDSWGIAQIHLPSWPDVSREEALDEDFAIEWMAKHWHKAIWYGYNRKTDKCN